MSKQHKKQPNSVPVMLVKQKHKNKNKKQAILTQLKVKGKGNYSLADIPAMVAKPFVDQTESKGIINKGARFVGKAIGSALPIPGAGEALGNAASWLARIFGAGKYKIKSNTLLSHNIAQFADNGSMTFSHREYVCDITSSVSFNNQNFLINAGNPTLFPWLSRIASNYEEFEFLGLIFEFKSMSATAVGSTNTGLGTLIMATDYDVVDANYTTKQAMEIADFATSDAPCYHQYHPVECDPKQNVMKKLFVQNATTLAGYPDDPRFSVLGNFQIATQGVQSASTVGELWVSYHVKLSKPQIPNNLATQTNAHAQIRTVNSSSVFLTTSHLYPSNGGIILSYTPGSVTWTCATSLGLGTYIAVVRGLNLSTTGTMSGASSAPTPSGGVTLVPDCYNLAGSTTGVSATTITDTMWTYNGSYTPSKGLMSTVIVTFTNIGGAITLPLGNDSGNTVLNDVWLIPYDLGNLTKPLSEKNEMRRQLNDIILKLGLDPSQSPVGSPEPLVNSLHCTQEENSPEYCTIEQHSVASNSSSNLLSRIPGVGAFTLQMPGSVRRT